MTKINSVRRAFGLWCAFLATGTWVIPPSALLLATRPAEASHSTDASSASELWLGTEIAQAWEGATGRAYNPASELILFTEGSPDLPVRVGIFAATGDAYLEVENSTVDWLPLGFVELDALTATDSSPHPTFATGEYATIAVTPRLVVGSTMVGGRAPGHFLGMSLTIDASPSASGESSEAARVSVFLPMYSFASVDLALAALDRADSAIETGGSDHSSGGSGIQCINPDWVGHNGVQCCEWKTLWDDELAECERKFWNDFWSCWTLAAGLVLVATVGCIASKCKWMPPIPPHFRVSCMTGCLVFVGGGGLLGAAWACYNHARGIERDCLRDANRYYQDKFDELGYALKPGGGQGAIVEILDAQKLQKGEGLEPASAN